MVLQVLHRVSRRLPFDSRFDMFQAGMWGNNTCRNFPPVSTYYPLYRAYISISAQQPPSRVRHFERDTIAAL